MWPHSPHEFRIKIKTRKTSASIMCAVKSQCNIVAPWRSARCGKTRRKEILSRFIRAPNKNKLRGEKKIDRKVRKQNELVEESVRAATEEPQRRHRKGDSLLRSYVVDAYLNYKLFSVALQVKFRCFPSSPGALVAAAALEMTSNDLFIWCPVLFVLASERCFSWLLWCGNMSRAIKFSADYFRQT